MSEKTFIIDKSVTQEWEELNLLFREVKKARDELKQKMLRAVFENETSGVVWVSAHERVRAVETKGRRFSIPELREKYGRLRLEEERNALVELLGEERLVEDEKALIERYGEEWIAANSGQTSSTTIEVKHMSRGRRG
jgi:hypothetical protein